MRPPPPPPERHRPAPVGADRRRVAASSALTGRATASTSPPPRPPHFPQPRRQADRWVGRIVPDQVLRHCHYRPPLNGTFTTPRVVNHGSEVPRGMAVSDAIALPCG